MGGIAAIVSAVAGVASTVSAMEAKDDAKEAAAADAAEQARVKAESDKKKAALAKAKGAASGMTGGGSTSQYINDLMKEQDAELSWIRKSGASRVKAAGSQYNQDIGAGLTQAGKGVYGAGQSFGWWG